MSSRLATFQSLLAGVADLAFLPTGNADLHYLLNIPREMPTFGAIMHPGAWLEGAWIPAQGEALLTVPRMTAEFGGLDQVAGIHLRVLGDWDNPLTLLREVTDYLPAQPRIAVSERTHAETLIHLQTLFPEARFLSATHLLRRLRVVKSEDEIELMRRAGALTEAAFAAVIPLLKIGMTELDVISEVDYQLRKQGALAPSFTTSLYNTGPNHPLLMGQPLQTYPRSLTPPVSVLFDFGAVLDGYCYDFGRTVSFGAPSAEQIRVHEVVMAAQAAGIAAMRAGEVTAEQVDVAARRVVEEAGYGAAFRHRLGHGIGMDVHEPPFLTHGDSTPLDSGMLFTVEPSILQDGGFSARVEDVIVVRPSGGEALTHGFQSLIVVE